MLHDRVCVRMFVCVLTVAEKETKLLTLDKAGAAQREQGSCMNHVPAILVDV